MRSKIKNLIDNSNSILLLTHESPDGDAIGSVLGFYHFLKSINKSVDMVISDIPRTFDFLPSIDKIVDKANSSYDLAIVLDCATKERISLKEDILSKCKNTICIDHHISNTNYCDVNLIEGDAPSCCQVIYYLFKEWGIAINNNCAIALITGLLTDTNGFMINTVNSDSFRMAAEVKNLGIDISNIYNEVLCKKSLAKHQLMQIGMNRLEFLCDGKIAYTYILKEDFEKTGASLGDHEGIVDIGRNIDGVEVSLFIREDNGWTVSLRSTGTVDVNKIALSIGGGGHFMAAGGKSHVSLEETKAKLIDEIKKGVIILMDGIIVVNKDLGYTSRDVVNIVAKSLNTKKVGHTGTLDPMATGVLVLCVGDALKLCELLTNHDKEYIAGITLGIETDTLDMEGNILSTKTVDIEKNKIFEVVNSFKGSYMQEVPKYSAVKVNGKKLYEYARKNIDVKLPSKLVDIHNIEILDDINYKDGKVYFKIKTTVSKGTYIRSLVRDIGQKLGVPSVMNSLMRNRQGDFNISQAYSIEDIKEGNFKLISILDAFPNIQKVVVEDDLAFKVRNGVILDSFFKEDMAFILDKKMNLIAIYENTKGKAKVYKMFNQDK